MRLKLQFECIRKIKVSNKKYMSYARFGSILKARGRQRERKKERKKIKIRIKNLEKYKSE